MRNRKSRFRKDSVGFQSCLKFDLVSSVKKSDFTLKLFCLVEVCGFEVIARENIFLGYYVKSR